MDPALQSLASGFPTLIFFLVLAAVLYVAGMVIYVKLTPHKEVELIREGNVAAATSFGAFLIALVLPLASCMASSVTLYDMLIWGSVSLLLQLFLFRITDLMLRGLPQRIIANDMSAAIILASFKLSGSILLASAIFVKF